MVRAIPKSTFSIVMKNGVDVIFIKGREYTYKQFSNSFAIKGENGTAKLSVEDVKHLFSIKEEN
ncbi:hypothetical protein [Kineothrix sedimenti]|uniref:Uncharacterized protein n=1 Tax=Kineothrix sedimenti TaxID=3123317 RepID=A0ABZ3EQI8_9FIRM